MITMAQKSKENRRAKGDGTVFQLKDGKWRAQITVGYKADGKPKKIYGKKLLGRLQPRVKHRQCYGR